MENKKIKILEMFGEPITYGGQEGVVYNMLSSFDLNKFNVELFTPYYADNEKLIKLIGSSCIHSLKIEFKTGDNRFLLKNSVVNFFKEYSNYDIVHIHTGSLSTMVLYSIIAKKFGTKKVICHAHIQGQKTSFIRNIMKFFMCKLLLKNVDYFVGCSKEAIEWEWTNDIIKQAKVINNGIDVNNFKFNDDFRNELIKKFDFKDTFVIGNVGRFVLQKNHYFMIDIFEKLLEYDKNFVLFLIGDGELKNNILEYAKNKKISNNIFFINNTEKVYKFYNLFDVFILPSKFEGLPLVGVEAQINGLWTLVSTEISKEINISKRCIFLDINSVNNWVDKIICIKKQNYNRFDDNCDINIVKYDKNTTFKYIYDIYLNKI